MDTETCSRFTGHPLTIFYVVRSRAYTIYMYYTECLHFRVFRYILRWCGVRRQHYTLPVVVCDFRAENKDIYQRISVFFLWFKWRMCVSYSVIVLLHCGLFSNSVHFIICLSCGSVRKRIWFLGKKLPVFNRVSYLQRFRFLLITKSVRPFDGEHHVHNQFILTSFVR